MRWSLNPILLLIACAYLTASASAQDIRQLTPIAPTASAAYPNTPDGLRHLLQDMFAAAKHGDRNALQATIANTEIPDYETWFAATFGAAKGGSLAEAYEKMLSQRERDFQRRITELSREEGYVSVKAIVATDMYDTLQGPLDVYLVSWSPPDSAGLPRRPTPVAYFFFVDGKFRWNGIATFADVPPASE